MKCQSPHHYGRLLNAQKLLKARDEIELASLKSNLSLLEQENDLLSTMMARGSHADFVDPLLISQRMERNRRTIATLEAGIDVQIKAWAKSSHRTRRLAEKQIQAQREVARTDLATSLGETMAHFLTINAKN